MLCKFFRFNVFFAILSLLPATFNDLSGQDIHAMRQAEDTLASILKMINQTTDDSIKERLNQAFSRQLNDALLLDGAGNYPFLSLRSLVKAPSPDNKFIMYLWNLPESKGKHRYFGFIKIMDQQPPRILPLKDLTDSIQSPEKAVLDRMHWLGALYYKIIPCESRHGRPFYTLLGWSGKDPSITRKVIEVLTFDDTGSPKFGLPVFPNFGGGKLTRIIFRYSGTTSMSLKYEEQNIATDKKWNSKKRAFEYKTRSEKMIVCDRLIPLDPHLEGQFQFYVAAGDVFDGFEFQNGNWNFIQGVDSRNRK